MVVERDELRLEDFEGGREILHARSATGGDDEDAGMKEGGGCYDLI